MIEKTMTSEQRSDCFFLSPCVCLYEEDRNICHQTISELVHVLTYLNRVGSIRLLVVIIAIEGKRERKIDRRTKEGEKIVSLLLPMFSTERNNDFDTRFMPVEYVDLH